MKTYSARPTDFQARWLVVDAEGKNLGRLATQIATVLRGKHKPIYTAHIDTGDHVVVINAAKVALTGRKAEDKKYFHHTMYPGGATWTSIFRVTALYAVLRAVIWCSLWVGNGEPFVVCLYYVKAPPWLNGVVGRWDAVQ